MQLAATSALAISFALAWPSAIVAGQQEIQSSAVGVQSPDRNCEAYWVDLFTTAGRQARRVIFVVESTSNQLAFAHSTFQRNTGAVWNSQSTACAIFDAPDNANVYVWVVKRRADQKWAVETIDVEKAVARLMPSAFAENVVRMGIEKLSWEGEESLNAHLTVNGKPIEVRLPISE